LKNRLYQVRSITYCCINHIRDDNLEFLVNDACQFGMVYVSLV